MTKRFFLPNPPTICRRFFPACRALLGPPDPRRAPLAAPGRRPARPTSALPRAVPKLSFSRCANSRGACLGTARGLPAPRNPAVPLSPRDEQGQGERVPGISPGRLRGARRRGRYPRPSSGSNAGGACPSRSDVSRRGFLPAAPLGGAAGTRFRCIEKAGERPKKNLETLSKVNKQRSLPKDPELAGRQPNAKAVPTPSQFPGRPLGRGQETFAPRSPVCQRAATARGKGVCRTACWRLEGPRPSGSGRRPLGPRAGSGRAPPRAPRARGAKQSWAGAASRPRPRALGLKLGPCAAGS